MSPLSLSLSPHPRLGVLVAGSLDESLVVVKEADRADQNSVEGEDVREEFELRRQFPVGGVFPRRQFRR